MSDCMGELTDRDVSGAAAQSLLFLDMDADRQDKPYPREFVTLGLVVFCLSFWTVVIYSVAG